MQAIIKLALKLPFKLRAFKIARMDSEAVRIDPGEGFAQADAYFNATFSVASVEAQQRMFVQAELVSNQQQSRTVGRVQEGYFPAVFS